MRKLKKGDITLGELYTLSKSLYEKEIDDKEKRYKLDIKAVRLVKRNNYEYDKKSKKWVQINKRSIRFEFLIRSEPISYKKTDTLKAHFYPVIFVLYDVEIGMGASFRYRSGSEKVWLKPRKGASKKEITNIANKNIQNKIDAHFLFHLEAVLYEYGLLYGRNRTGYLPKKTNTDWFPYFEKHSLYIIEKFFIPFFNNKNFKPLLGLKIANTGE